MVFSNLIHYEERSTIKLQFFLKKAKDIAIFIPMVPTKGTSFPSSN